MLTPENVLAAFSSQVFNLRTLRGLLSEAEWIELKQCLESGKWLTRNLADRIAFTMKEWAMSKGATHFTHWFQPMTGSTAEKHDSFLHWSGRDQKFSVDFSGRDLVKGESDASLFPSGGTRATFEARGYTVWDMSSPAFIRKSVNGATLYIPTAFCSWTGDALDTKTPLLRSDAAINKAVKDLDELLEETRVQRAFSCVGAEQEFFLIERSHYLARPDLISAKRTLIGNGPIQLQEFGFHYFGETPPRVLAFMQEAEIELAKLGVPMLARHNEAAPGQFEMAPIFEPVSLAADHNMLMMNLLQETAHRHGFEVLLHEKPFEKLNGSGKHLNYSISITNDPHGHTGNVFEPGDTPLQNMRFMVFLSAALRGIHLHADLLRWVTLSPGNEHRLGEYEAPPAVISVYIGDHLDAVCRTLMGEDVKRGEKSGILSLGVSALPQLPRDSSDKNRTSPIAFTGNRIEFRTVGSSQSIAVPLTILNAIMADSIQYMSETIKEKMQTLKKTEAIQEVVKEVLKQHYSIVYNGDSHAEDYLDEAKKRGLLDLKDPVKALEVLTQPENIKLLEKTGVLSQREIQARSRIAYEQYMGQILTEAAALAHIVRTRVLPASYKQQEQISLSLSAFHHVCAEENVYEQKTHLKTISSHIESLLKSTKILEKILEVHKSQAKSQLIDKQFTEFHPKITGECHTVRTHCDALEQLVDANLWDLPIYEEILCH